MTATLAYPSLGSPAVAISIVLADHGAAMSVSDITDRLRDIRYQWPEPAGYGIPTFDRVNHALRQMERRDHVRRVHVPDAQLHWELRP